MKKALTYFFAFIALNFTLQWATFAVWLMSAGSSFADVTAMFAGKTTLPLDAPMMITASGVYSITVLAVFLGCRWAVLSRNYLRSRPWGVFFWCAVAALGTIVPSLWLQQLLPELPDSTEAIMRQLLANDYGYFVLCLLAPLVEELVFRGAILRALLQRQMHPWLAIGISAICFALAHANPAQMPHALLMGLLLGWMFVRTGSILPGVLVHWVNNTVVFVTARLFPWSADMELQQLLGNDQGRMMLALLFSMSILVPALYQLHLRMKKG